MEPIRFKEATKVLQKPGQMTDEECGALHVWSDGKQCVSCWKASFKERLYVLFTGKVYLSVMSGKTQPPVWMAGERVFAPVPLSVRVKAFIELANGVFDDAVRASSIGIYFAIGAIAMLAFGIPFGNSLFVPVVAGLLCGALMDIVRDYKKGVAFVYALNTFFAIVGAAVMLFALLLYGSFNV